MEDDGPDVLTSCGVPGRLLQLGTSYIVGIGGPCSPLESWSEPSTFSAAELELLRELSGAGDTTAGDTTASVTDAATVPAMSLIAAVFSVVITAVSLDM